MTDILIRGGRVIDPASGFDGVADVLVSEGAIQRIAAGIEAPSAEVIDARAARCRPGLDLHVHLANPVSNRRAPLPRRPERPFGGFTTVCAMPNTSPAPTVPPRSRWRLQERVARDAHVRVLPIGCVYHGREGQTLAELGEWPKRCGPSATTPAGRSPTR
jgi:dihydroorotase